MKIRFYRSFLCPRCLLVARELSRLCQRHPDLEVETVEATLHPTTAWQAGVRMVPALEIGGRFLAGWILLPAQVRRFVEEAMATRPSGPVGEVAR
ncbi:MAG: hypothetical protein AB1634_14535 [Thermodesulfobacteriota bacterium]